MRKKIKSGEEEFIALAVDQNINLRWDCCCCLLLLLQIGLLILLVKQHSDDSIQLSAKHVDDGQLRTEVKDENSGDNENKPKIFSKDNSNN